MLKGVPGNTAQTQIHTEAMPDRPAGKSSGKTGNAASLATTKAASPAVLARQAKLQRARAGRMLPDGWQTPPEHSRPVDQHGAGDDHPPSQMPSTRSASTAARVARLASQSAHGMGGDPREVLKATMLNRFALEYPELHAQHRPYLEMMEGEALEALLPLVEQQREWVSEQLPVIAKTRMSSQHLQEIVPLVEAHKEWLSKNLPGVAFMPWPDQVPALSLYLERHADWTAENLFCLSTIYGDQLHDIFPVVNKDPDWASMNIMDLGQMMQPGQLQAFSQLFDAYEDWAKEHFSTIKDKDAEWLENVRQILDLNKKWATENIDWLDDMSGKELGELIPLFHPESNMQSLLLNAFGDDLSADWLIAVAPIMKNERFWAVENMDLLLTLAPDVVDAVAHFLEHEPEWLKKNIDVLAEKREMLLYLYEHSNNALGDVSQAMKEIEKHFDEYGAFSPAIVNRTVLNMTDKASGEFNSAANPYVRDLLKTDPVDGSLKAHGVSRSLLDPRARFASSLTEAFRRNQEKLPHATFGVEVEMFVPGMDIDEALTRDGRRQLNERLGTTGFRFVRDGSLRAPTTLAGQIEMTTPPMRSHHEIMELQGALSILHDWGAFTNKTAGVHIHTGVKQWSTEGCLGKEACSQIPGIEKWDLSDHHRATPAELLFMKQLAINMVAMQQEFDEVARNSRYAMPNAYNGVSIFSEQASRAQDLDTLIEAVQRRVRYHCVNLLSYKEHGTVEIRGFTKKNSDSMGVDPNVPIRDIVFLQEVLIKTIDSMKAVFRSGVSPDKNIQLKPSDGLNEIADRYAQNVFMYQIMHALVQRQAGKRVKTMSMLIDDRSKIRPETLTTVAANLESLMESDSLGRHFLSALRGDTTWNPSAHLGNEQQPLRRTRSLRNMSDIIARKP